MATLILGAAGGALGSVFGGVGFIVGRAAGAIAGSVVDRGLFGARRAVEGPRLSDLEVQSSTEGVVLSRLYGRARLAGQMIWATDFEEVKKTETQGGKGGPSVTTTEYRYFANFAVALCEGPVSRVGRIWADGKLLDRSAFTIRIHDGDETQLADSLIAAKQPGGTPAYRGTAYAVFERMPLADFGNRIPQLAFEVTRRVPGMEEHVRAVCVIPGSTEFGYDTAIVSRTLGKGRSETENAHALRDASDWTVSIDELQATCPALQWVTLVIAWFGDDLRAGACTIRPKVDSLTKETRGATWAVGGLARAEAEPVSLVDGRPAYGGTPSDASVMRAIADLKARGLKVALAPFVMMDIPADNALPDPYGGTTGQPAYPWRGDITCDPAPGVAGSPDKSAAAGTQVSAFLGTAAAGDFSAGSGGVAYSGPNEWRYRRMVLHYAHLGVAAGGIDALLIGSELRGLTTLRSGASAYPFVTGLRTLAGDVRGIVGGTTKLTYGADWSEYFGHQPADGTGDVHFHLDPLWADAAIDAVGIDLYHPLADWRDAPDHADELSGRAPYNPDYLRGNIRGGEGFDWYYADPADRAAQARTPISDGGFGKPWVFRFKDLEAWWSNPHFDRPGGVEAAAPTAWTAKSKPIWLTELGCPAVDKGANQPNVFPDPKSSASGLPYFSSGGRDDVAQRSYLEAYLTFFDPAHPDFAGSNPLSDIYGGRMVDPAHIHLWAWDARPYPYFPELTEAWSDGGNWQRGHWLNGRLGAVPIGGLIAAILRDHDFTDFAAADAYGLVGGYVVNEVLSARATLEPLLEAFRVDAADAGDRVLFRGRARPHDATILRDDLIDEADRPLIARVRAQETELASEVTLKFLDPARDYHVTAASSRRLAGESLRMATVDLPAIVDFGEAERRAALLLRDIWIGRETAEGGLGPGMAAIEAGDILRLEDGPSPETLLAERIEDGEGRRIHARRIDNRLSVLPHAAGRLAAPGTAPHFGPPEIRILDIPTRDGADAHAPRFAAFADPWPGRLAVYQGAEGGGFRLVDVVSEPATIGTLAAPLAPGALGIVDRGVVVDVTLLGGALASLPAIDVLGGGNLAAVECADGAWEILQFADAELAGPDRYRLTGLIRGQGGSEEAMRAGATVGAAFVLLDAAVSVLPLGVEALGTPLRHRFGPARDDHAAPSFVEVTVTAAGRGLRPSSPVHLRAAREEGSDDIVLRWIRRTRFGGDNWALAEAPLNEAFERYRVEVWDGSSLKRTMETGVPEARYSLVDQTSDFGSPAPSFTARIAQLSAAVGPGFALEEIVDV